MRLIQNLYLDIHSLSSSQSNSYILDVHEIIMTREHKTTLAEYLQPLRVEMDLEKVLPIMKKHKIFLQVSLFYL